MKSQWLACALLLSACLPKGAGDGGVDPRDVRGNYDLTYDNQLKLQLNIGGAIREVTQTGYGGIADFGTYNGQPVQLDLTAFCAKPEVQCPSESFWSKVSVDMPDLEKNRLVLQGIQVIDNENAPARRRPARAGGGRAGRPQQLRPLPGRPRGAGRAGGRLRGVRRQLRARALHPRGRAHPAGDGVPAALGPVV